MSRSASVGFWIAIVFLAIIATVCIGLYFYQYSEERLLYSRAASESPQMIVQRWSNRHVERLIESRKRLEVAYDDIRTKDLVAARDNLRKLQMDAAKFIRLQDDMELRKQMAAKNSEIIDAAMRALERENDRARTAVDENLERMRDRYKRLALEFNQQQERSSIQSGKHKERHDSIIETALRRIRELELQNDVLRDAIKKVVAAPAREALQLEQYDGRIIRVDPNARFVAIDLGLVHGIKRGMRFEVIRWRLNKWQQVGAIVVTKVGPASSIATIAYSITQRKIDTRTGYVAPNPEQRYSPYATRTTEEGRDKVLHLLPAGTEVESTMNEFNPIIVGDNITNPFFREKESLKFVLCGDSVKYPGVPLSRKFYDMQYPPDYQGIKPPYPHYLPDVIRQCNGVVQQEIDAETDALIIGRIPDASRMSADRERAEVIKRYIAMHDTAKRYGVPILYEVHMFEFLRD